MAVSTVLFACRGACRFSQFGDGAIGQRLGEGVQHVLRGIAGVVAGQVPVHRCPVEVVAEGADDVWFAPAFGEVSVEVVGQSVLAWQKLLFPDQSRPSTGSTNYQISAATPD